MTLMVISYFGAGMIKVTQGDSVIVFNPIGEARGWEPVRFGADVALVSLRDKRYNGIPNVTRGERVPRVIEGPGEYEIAGVFIQGFKTVGSGERLNTVYSVVIDGIRLVHLGALAESELSLEIMESLGSVEVLFVPISGEGIMDFKQAAKLVVKLSPKIIIPIDYADDKVLQSFLKEVGEGNETPVPSLALKKKDLQDKEGEVIVIKS